MIFKIPLFRKLYTRHFNMNRRSDNDAKCKKADFQQLHLNLQVKCKNSKIRTLNMYMTI